METPHKNQLRWACRRGMLELDQFLLAFFDGCYDNLSIAEQETFQMLLSEQDQDLYNWLLNISSSANKNIQALCEKIRNHAYETF